MDLVFHWNFVFPMTLLHRARLNPFKNFMDIYKCRKLFMALKGKQRSALSCSREWVFNLRAGEARDGVVFICSEVDGGGGIKSVIKMLILLLRRKAFDFYEKNAQMKTLNFSKLPKTGWISHQTPQQSTSKIMVHVSFSWVACSFLSLDGIAR